MTKRMAIPVLTVLLVAAMISPSAGQSSSHGVGLCMAGVKIMASTGSNYQSILTHYYTGTQVTSFDTNRSIRVGVFSDPSVISLIAEGPYSIEAINIGGNASDVITVGYNGQYALSINGGPSISSPTPFRINAGSGTMQVNGWLNWNRQNYRVKNIVEVRFVSDSSTASDNNKLWAINELPLEEYVAGILEEPDSWPFEGLKVLAVAARTYALNKILYGGKHRNAAGNIFDVDSTAHCQQYIGYWTDRGGANHRAAQEQTAGQVVTYDGKPIVAAYSGSCPGGRTKSSEEAGWGYYAYLRSVPCPHTGNASVSPGTIYGKVISSVNRQAIPGTAVRAGDKVVPTSSSGEFRISLSPDTYTVFYDAPGYQGQTQEGIVVGSAKTTSTPMVILSPPSGEILGRVLNTGHQPIPGAAIRINSSVVPPNGGGEFRFARMYKGVYTIYYDAPGHAGQSQENIVVDGTVARPPMALLSKVSGEIRGFVLDSQKRPIPGTVVRIDNSIQPTNPGGEFRFTLVHNGSYTIYYDAPGFVGQKQELINVSGAVTQTPTVIMSRI
jgi:hypothetical protein